MTDFLTEYEALATEIATEVRMASAALGDKIDALKALTPFYVHKMKNMKVVEDTDDLPNFENFTNQIHASETINGSDKPGVRGSRRNGN